MEDLKPIAFEGIDTSRPLIIAGPCSAETEEQVLCTAQRTGRQRNQNIPRRHMEAAHQAGWF